MFAKLNAGDEVRIIAPSFSATMIPKNVWDLAVTRLRNFGLKVSFGKHVNEVDILESSSISSRLDDFHDAFTDKNVKGIICAIGGYNSNFLLDEIDWELVRKNPKFFGGMSDITVLCNAIYKMTGLETYQMPNFRNFGQLLGADFSLEYFKKMALVGERVEVVPSELWSDDKWAKNQEKRKFIRNSGWWWIQKGSTEGISVGGNLCSINLLQGTKYMPSLENKILFLEDDSMSTVGEFSRNLRSLIHAFFGARVKGLVLGRFQKKTKMTVSQLRMIVGDISELRGIPIVANVDFGHTDPKITWKIGGKVEIKENPAQIWLG